MDIVVKGRNVEVPEHYRQHVADKLEKIERYDEKIIRVDVELFHEPNRRQHDRCQRVELTCVSRGPVVRAEACAKDFYAALDLAAERLAYQLRRAADRRRIHRGRHTPVSVAEATAALATSDAGSTNGSFGLPPLAAAAAGLATKNGHAHDDSGVPARWRELADDEAVEDGPGRIVREKEHTADPITVDDALFNMELVGHDFYLFVDKEVGRPSVVYRRKGYDYGVIRLAD